MSRKGEFLVYCIEIYKRNKSLNGKETIKLFKKYNIDKYVTDYYEALHTTGENYIIEDIDKFIQNSYCSG